MQSERRRIVGKLAQISAAEDGRPLKLVMALSVAAILAVLIGLLVVLIRERETTSRSLTQSSEAISSGNRRLLEAIGYVQYDQEIDPDLVGVTRYDTSGAYDGYNFFMDHQNRPCLMDMTGEVLRTWSYEEVRIGSSICQHAELLGNGDVIVICYATQMIRLSWDGAVLWSYQGQVHHDVAELPDGGLLVPEREDRRLYKGYRDVRFDRIVKLTADGELDRVVWSTYENLEELQQYHHPSELDGPVAPQTRSFYEKVGYSEEHLQYYHLNTIDLLPRTPLAAQDRRFSPGNYLVSMRQTDLVVILDKDTLEVVWHWGPDQLEWQHMPTMLPDGNILIFDNGTRRGFSRVVELEPRDQTIVWEYRADPPSAFFSARRGSCQRLPNGNTLICEGDRGHAFEVSPDGEMLWEFWNPIAEEGKRSRIYRMIRVDPDEPDRFGTPVT